VACLCLESSVKTRHKGQPGLWEMGREIACLRTRVSRGASLSRGFYIVFGMTCKLAQRSLTCYNTQPQPIYRDTLGERHPVVTRHRVFT
jgi:hypothetical protein